MADPLHPENQEVRGWWGEGEFDTSDLSVDGINSLLAMLDSANQPISSLNLRGRHDFAGLSQDAVHELLYQTFNCPDVLQWQVPESPNSAPVIRMLQVLLEAMGDKGLKLTPKGNLPVAAVRAMIDAGIADQLSRYASFDAQARSEDDSLAVHVCRIIAELSGLMHKQRGRLLPRKRILNLAQKDQWDQIYLHLLKSAMHSFNWAYMDRHDEMQGIQVTAPYTLWLVHRSGDAWQDEAVLLEDWLRAFPVLVHEAQDCSYALAREVVIGAMGHRLFLLYQWFGLIEQLENPSKSHHDRLLGSWSIRKGPLFDQVVRFSAVQ